MEIRNYPCGIRARFASRCIRCYDLTQPEPTTTEEVETDAVTTDAVTTEESTTAKVTTEESTTAKWVKIRKTN